MRLAATGHGLAARRRRRPGCRRGVTAPAALPVAVRGDRAGAHRRGAPPPGVARPRRRSPRAWYDAAPGHEIELDPLDPGGHPPAARRSVPGPVLPADRRDLRRSAAGCRSRRWSSASSAGTGTRRRPAAPAVGERRKRCSGWRCSARSSPPTSCSPSRGRARTPPTSSSRRRCRPGSSNAQRPATGSGTPWCASGLSRRSRRASWPRCGARSLSGSPGSAVRLPGWRTCSSQPASPRERFPTSLRAVETAGALGAYRDALAMIDAVRRPRRPGRSAAAARTSR